ncbi:MAG TPA: Mut7-C RNAse domain-containing protein [Streptosporangiaceae bacterium]|nr:Mut7-C RNAse domain-containing protein [Streptosporangiaceae bacterium]
MGENGTPRFLCDAMLGRLARWLRILGYDAAYADLPDDALVALAQAEGRVLLTRDTRLVRRPDVGPHAFIRHDRVQDQLRQMTAAFGLRPGRAGTRCLCCNVALEALPRDAAAGRVPPYVWRTQQQFVRCPACARIYWPGTHWDHMTRELSGLRPKD